MENLNGIRNIIFDLGGVLLNIDFKKTFDAFAALGIKDAHAINDRPEVWQLFLDLECGKVEKEDFLRRFRELVSPPAPLKQGVRENSLSLTKEGLGWISDEAIISAFNALLLDYPPERIRLVQELSKKYRVFLLSNTNAIHVEYYNEMLSREFGIENLDQLMEKAFYSNELGCRKPDREIYLKVLKLADIKAEETLFIDDNEDNVKAAEELGIRGVRVDEELTVMGVFRHLSFVIRLSEEHNS
ncbi:MAG: HAD family phosphatase [Bacteroidota bacterium]|nr:HAD family phosphatase [Bacteroidota bacterium]